MHQAATYRYGWCQLVMPQPVVAPGLAQAVTRRSMNDSAAACAARTSDQLGQPRDAVSDLVGARQRIAQAQGVAAAAVMEERSPRHEGDARLLDRTVEQASRIDGLGQA